MAALRLPCESVFFSSRRRHTRFDCDWSSDVCSSDLHYLHHDRGGVPFADPGELAGRIVAAASRSEEHTSELQSQSNLVCRLLLEKKKREDALDEPVKLQHRVLRTLEPYLRQYAYTHR